MLWGGGGLAVNPLVPEGFYMPVFLSPGPSSRGVVIEGTVDDDGTLVEDKAEQDSVLAFYMWFTPMIGDFLPRSSVNGNSDKYTLFGEKVNYTTYEEDGLMITETEEKPGRDTDVYFRFEYDPDSRTLSFVQSLLYTTRFAPSGVDANENQRLHVTWSDGLEIDEDNSIHGEIFWAFYQTDSSTDTSDNKMTLTYGNADFYSDDDIVGSVAMNAYTADFDVSDLLAGYDLTADDLQTASMEQLGLILSIGRNSRVQTEIHSINESNIGYDENGTGEARSQYFILAYCEKKGSNGKANRICLGQSLVSFISGSGDREGSQEAIRKVTSGWIIEDYSE